MPCRCDSDRLLERSGKREMWARKKEDVGRKALVTNTAQPGGLRAFGFLRQRYPGQREKEEGNKQ
jgi:hypothetical protein